ncbi:MAG: hypothetical protein J0I99_04170 [Devosia sp.]|uniref:hypothetical protein n=1 Tax=Devosia sp. TaxID=1871048 RepID=UPI001AC8BB27|nr:hypothetical protein [Devosia sp.]MBN9308780.1 hypothetical protein [Devosia sp.]MBN9314911.1 hypothetical protein [Devosia sp.]
MAANNHFRGLLAEDTPAGNDGDTPGFAQPVSQTEIEELLYGDDWPIEERLARLKAVRDEMLELEPTDFGDDDPQVLVRAIDDAIARLEQLGGEGMDPTSVDHDATAHRETLAPDSDELEEIAEADEASYSEDEADDDSVDKSQWIDGEDRDEEAR